MLEEKRLAVLRKAWEVALCSTHEPGMIARAKVVEAFVRMGRLEDALRAAWDVCEGPDTDLLGVVFRNLVEQGRVGEALRLAESVKEDWRRALALCKLAEALISNGRSDEAIEIVGRMLEAMRRMRVGQLERSLMPPSYEILPSSVSSLVLDLVRSGRVREAMWIVHSVKSVEDLEKAPQDIAFDLIFAGYLDEALEVVRSIENTFERVHLLCRLSEAFAKAGRLDRVQEIAGEIAEKGLPLLLRKWGGFSVIIVGNMRKMAAVSLAMAGRLEEALKLARSVESEVGLCHILVNVAAALAVVGRSREALSVLEEVARVAYGLRDETMRDGVLQEMIEVYMRLGEVDRALKVSRELKNAGARARAAITVAGALAEAGRIDDAARVLSESKDLWRIFSEALDFDTQMLVTKLVRAGLLDEALVEVRRVKDKHERLRASIGAVRILMQAERFEEALALVKELVKEIENAVVLSTELASIARAFAERGRFEEVLSVAKSIEDKNSRSEALASLAAELAHAGRFEEALALVREVESTAGLSGRLASIAMALAERGRFEEALSIAKNIEDAFERSYALSAVVRMLARERRFEEASKVAGGIEDTFSRLQAMLCVSEALAEVGRLEEALALIEEVLETGRRSLIGYECLGDLVYYAVGILQR